MLKKLRSNRITRFIIVGTCNAAISFGLLNLAYYSFHRSKIMASIISTTCALIFSFIMNRNFVFADKSKKAHQQAPAFILVTISGSFIILNLVYILSLKILNGHEGLFIEPVKVLTSVVLSKSFIEINVSTVAGAVVALFWNYNGYKWFVFKGSKKDASEEVTLTA